MSNLLSLTGYFVLLTTQVMCEGFSQCYNDVNICLWTDGSVLNQSAAETVCKQRNSFLPRIPNCNLQSKLGEFRSADENQNNPNLLAGSGFWIDVRAVAINDFHWIDGLPLAG